MFLQFSDSAKFADIAKNLINGLGFGNSFSFWSSNIFELIKTKIFLSPWTPPIMPYSIAGFFKIFGVGDFAVIATSFFYFILTLVFVFLLAKKVFNNLPAQAGKLVGALSILAVGFNYDLIHYAKNGASESPFIFEIVAASYFASIKKRWANVVTILLLILMYFTRPQAFIYIAGIILYWLLVNFKLKKALLIFAGVIVCGLIVDRFVLWPLGGQMFLYSITGRGITSTLAQGTSIATSDNLRGANLNFEGFGLTQLLKNIFYNLYNFYKLLPQIINPYLFAIFIVGLFRPSPKAASYAEMATKAVPAPHAFKIASVFMVIVTLLVTAASTPFYRYIHPIIPLVYILAVGTLVEIINKLSSPAKATEGQANTKFVILSSLFLIFAFGVGQTLGVLLLDSRFERNTHNVGKPPVYVELSKILKENTNPSHVVITNLDTWGSWYGERKTVWFPLEPKQLIDPTTSEIPFDAIYLTSYLIDDPNYYMGTDWRTIFDNPGDSKKWTCDGCSEIAREYTLRGVYEVPASDNYERLDASAILLIKK